MTFEPVTPVHFAPLDPLTCSHEAWTHVVEQLVHRLTERTEYYLVDLQNPHLLEDGCDQYDQFDHHVAVSNKRLVQF